MSGVRVLAFFFVAAVLGVVGGVVVHARSGRQGAAAAGQTSDEERAALGAKGKAIFVEKCAKCHNEGGDKALSSGKPLNERGLSSEVIARAVNGRLKDRTDVERRAVTLYIASLMKAKDSEGAIPKP